MTKYYTGGPVGREYVPISRRGGLAARTKNRFFAVLSIPKLTKKMIKNHEINEYKMLKGLNFQKNKLYEIAIFIFFKY